MLSSYRPKVPLYIFTKHESLINQMSLAWGVRAFYMMMMKGSLIPFFLIR
ncbi:pyruvate kinase alpha/beta domain-containing protein [Niabella ginsengisoli]|uniref:Pyruvate kinase C-terminal domain-containing protein n=1 Tax=Niabella ginsengisoli TaxID=522298 RepID=A0ABS9SM70_9BACT|nr:pyruvate kinase alpha/beta domain-containing protein [Niabella ginsengisoli]MCH5599475.1 hypothetical protein [Niabella ginsengisoli]